MFHLSTVPRGKLLLRELYSTRNARAFPGVKKLNQHTIERIFSLMHSFRSENGSELFEIIKTYFFAFFSYGLSFRVLFSLFDRIAEISILICTKSSLPALHGECNRPNDNSPLLFWDFPDGNNSICIADR